MRARFIIFMSRDSNCDNIDTDSKVNNIPSECISKCIYILFDNLIYKEIFLIQIQ